MIYRFKFEKRDEVKYIGHLDTMRTFTRCIKKTKLPIKFSSGFNPRVQLSFALPLAVGVTSESEYFDLELNGDLDEEEVLKELSKTLPDGFKLIECKKEEKPKSLMSLVKEAVYEYTLILNCEEISKIKNQIESELDKENIIVEKNSKDGKVDNIDIKPLILDYKVEDVNYNTIIMQVHSLAGSKSNLNPNYIIQFIQKLLGEDVLDDYCIHRKSLII